MRNNQTVVKLGIVIFFSILIVGIISSYESSSSILQKIESVLSPTSTSVTTSSATFASLPAKSISTLTPASSSLSPSSTSVTTSSATFTSLPAKSISTLTPASSSLSPSSTSVTTSSITGVRILSTNAAPTTSTTSGTIQSYTPIFGESSSTNPDSITSTASGTIQSYTPIFGESSSTNPDSITSTVTGTSVTLNQIVLDLTTTEITLDPNDGITEVVVTSSGITLNTITVPKTVPNSDLNVGDILNTEQDGDKSVTFANGFTIYSQTNDVNVDVTIPNAIKMIGPSSWDGKIELPTAEPTSSVSVGGTVTSVTEIGAGNIQLSFDEPVRIDLAGMAGQGVGFSGTLGSKVISTTCNADNQNTVASQLGGTGECQLDVGADKVVWSYHFTTFFTFSGASGGGGGGSTPGFPPSFTTGFSPDKYPFTINSTGFKYQDYSLVSSTNNTAAIQTGKPFAVKVLEYGDSGSSSVQHVTLFTDLYGTKDDVQDSDTVISWDEASGLVVVDPHHFFENVTAIPTQNDGKFELDYTITFARPMPNSGIILRTWGTDLFASDTYIPHAWEADGETYSTVFSDAVSTIPSDLTLPDLHFVLNNTAEQNQMSPSAQQALFQPSLVLSGSGNFTLDGQVYTPFNFNIDCGSDGSCSNSSIEFGNSIIPVNTAYYSDGDGNVTILLDSHNLQCNVYDLGVAKNETANNLVFDCFDPFGSGLSSDAVLIHH
jgi:hypothetical protein